MALVRARVPPPPKFQISQIVLVQLICLTAQAADQDTQTRLLCLSLSHEHNKSVCLPVFASVSDRDRLRLARLSARLLALNHLSIQIHALERLDWHIID